MAHLHCSCSCRAHLTAVGPLESTCDPCGMRRRRLSFLHRRARASFHVNNGKARFACVQSPVAFGSSRSLARVWLWRPLLHLRVLTRRPAFMAGRRPAGLAREPGRGGLRLHAHRERRVPDGLPAPAPAPAPAPLPCIAGKQMKPG